MTEASGIDIMEFMMDTGTQKQRKSTYIEPAACFAPDLPIMVVGGINADIQARADGPLIMRDSNPGRVSSSLGGVGFNIARNLSCLGADVRMMSALSSDRWAGLIKKEAAGYGIDLSPSLKVRGAATSTYVYICGPDGEMDLAVCDAEILKALDEKALEARMDIINASGAVVLDTNLEEKAIRFLSENCRVPLFADPVSVIKAARLKPVLSRIFAMKPNRLEAEVLSGIAIRDQSSAAEAASALVEFGVEHVFLSLGNEGICCAARGEETVFLKADPVDAACVNGAGDAATAAMVRSFFLPMASGERAGFVLSAGALAVSQKETVLRRTEAAKLLNKYQKERS